MSSAPPRILIIGGDADLNRGDRAILAGVLRMVREVAPTAEITVFGRDNPRDVRELGVISLPKGISRAWLPKLRAMLRAEVVIWRGGVSLHDHTSVVKVPFWFLHIVLLRLLGKPIYAIAQGIGPLRTGFGRLLAGWTVRLLEGMTVRDEASLELIRSCGTGRTPLAVASDSALALEPVCKDLGVQAFRVLGIPIDPQRPLIGVGALRWFHLEGSILPHELKVKLGMVRTQENPANEAVRRNLAAALDELVEQHHAQVVFFPMYLAPWVDDCGEAEAIRGLMRHAEEARVIAQPLEASQFLSLFAPLTLMIGMRMHSTLMATLARTPTIGIYYEPKGRAYFGRLGREDYTLDIRELADADGLGKLRTIIDRVMNELPAQRAHLERRIPELQAELEPSRALIRKALGTQLIETVK